MTRMSLPTYRFLPNYRSGAPRGSVRLQQFKAFSARRGAADIKQVDNDHSGLIANANYSPIQDMTFNTPVQGAAQYQRVGNVIKMIGLDFRWEISSTSADTTGIAHQTNIRMVIVYDRQPNNSTVPYNTIFKDQYPDGSTATTDHSAVALQQKERFIVLMDKTIAMPVVAPNSVTDGGAAAGNSTSELVGRRYIKLKDLQTVYSASTGAATDIQTGSLTAYFIRSNLTMSVTDTWAIHATGRLTYSDA